MSIDGDWPSSAELERLRVDLYADDGRWFDTRDIPDFSAARPVSFSVYSDDETREKFAWVRLRAYPPGRLQDVPAQGVPRLVVDGVDVTPSTEPARALTVDRLVLVRLRPGFQGQVAVTLHGACAGVDVVLRSGDSSRGPIVPQARTCLDHAPDRAVVGETVATARAPIARDGRQWSVEACPSAVSPERVCVPGGPMLLGATDLALVRGEDPSPERLVVVSRFAIDRDEVTVGRYRAALAAGMPPSDLPPETNPGLLMADSRNESATGCTWSDAPVGREDHPLNCIARQAARAFCKYVGGDLPTEAQWEYVTSVAGREHKASYVWGEDAPDCSRAVWGRGQEDGDDPTCKALGLGVRPVAESADVTPLGVRGLAGSLTEWTIDVAKPYDDPCWASAPRLDPSCVDETATAFVARGGAWDSAASYLRSTNRFRAGLDRRSPILGFRCVYPQEGP